MVNPILWSNWEKWFKSSIFATTYLAIFYFISIIILTVCYELFSINYDIELWYIIIPILLIGLFIPLTTAWFDKFLFFKNETYDKERQGVDEGKWY